MIFGLCGNRRQRQGAGCWGERGKMQYYVQSCSSVRARLYASWVLEWGFDPSNPHRHAIVSRFHSQELKMLGDRYLLLVQTQTCNCSIFDLWIFIWTLSPENAGLHLCFLLPFITLPDVSSEQAHNSASMQLKCLGNASGCLKCKGTEMISAIKLFI